MINMMSLEEIGIQHGADKTVHHGLFSFYEKHVQHLRDEPINLLEIGVLQGRSIVTWREFFKNANSIQGADVNPTFESNMPADTSFHLLDQFDIVSLQRFAKNAVESKQMFDIIVEDGCHQQRAQQNTLFSLWPCVKPGGFYFLEDIHCSFHPNYNNLEHFVSVNTMELIMAINNRKHVNIDGLSNEAFTYEQLKSLLSELQLCDVFGNGVSMACALQKKC